MISHGSLKGLLPLASSAASITARRSMLGALPLAANILGKRFFATQSSQRTAVQYQWPRSKVNTGLNICPQGEVMVIERLGKFSSIQTSGLFFAIPVIDQIRYRITMMEQSLRIEPLHAITGDNVSVSVSGNVFFNFADAYKAAYGHADPTAALSLHAQASMRNTVGEMELDEILKGRVSMNKKIKESLQAACQNWGIIMTRYEVTDITPQTVVRDSMDKQAAAERVRREQVILAEAAKESAKLKSEGVKIQLANESEGHLIKQTNEAEGRKRQLVLEAQGYAQAVQMQADATALAMKTIGEALNGPNGERAALLQVAEKQIEMMAKIGSTSNTMFFQDKPVDVNSLLAQAKVVMNSTMTKP